ncbi:MAG: amidohydrolase/deacetylase family metallohydrolase [Verrucomicrobiales bacterium]
MTYDWLIRGGRVVDPLNNLDSIRDVAVQDGRIAAVSEALDPESAQEVFDARGLLVVPGLIDLHMHGYDLVTPLGLDVDHYCLGRGVTTAVDAGSAGCDTFAGFRAFAAERFRTRLLAFLHISRTGLSFAGLGGDNEVPGELESLRFANARDCADCIEANRDLIVGVKIRLSDSIADGGRNEAEAYRRAREASAAVGLPLMVHHNFSTVPYEDCPGKLSAGDIWTHCYHGFPSSIVDPETRRVHPVVRAAAERGVLFDVGHGQGSFNWTVAEIAVGEGFWPRTISSDLHRGTAEGPCYDLLMVMSRLLHLGMPLDAVIRATTCDVASSIGRENRLGALSVGREADITVLALEDVDQPLEDCQSQMRRVRRLLRPRAVWRGGVPSEITRPRRFPNPVSIESQKQWWPRLLVRDASLES